MRSSIIGTATAVLLATTFGGTARAQNPYHIDGTVTDANNSGVCAGGGSLPCAQAVKTLDPFGSVKELGPINSNVTKVGVINSAAPPMLGFTNPNSQVDLKAIYTQTAKAVNGDLWYYFGWVRDSNSGSGFLSIEMQQSGVPSGCAYSGIDQTSPTSAAALIASCNPWQNRQAGDFLILWDQSGGSTDVLKRVFSGTAPNLTLGPATSFGSAEAIFSADGFRGEAAIDLTTDVFPATGACQTFANTIPGTVTGNSDQADYKDAVLAAFPPVTNCGSVSITKVTNPAGLSGTFTYTLSAGGSAIFHTGEVDSDCTVSGPSNLTTCSGTLITPDSNGSATDTISNLRENDSNWTLTESDPGPLFSVASIVCVSNGTIYNLYGALPLSTTFPVQAGQTTACTITNDFVKTTPSQTTSQTGYAQIKDAIALTGITPGASDASSATVSFALYTVNTCSGTPVATAGPFALTYTDGGTKASAAMTTPVSVTAGPTYYWKVTYSGDAFNEPVTTSCGQETATISFGFFGN